MRPERPVVLGSGYELWTGLFQSAVLGNRPYLNVDIAHKAFPLPMNLVEVFRMNGADPQRDLDFRSREGFITHMKGLRITYEMPGQNTSTKCYKFTDLGQTPDKIKFKNEQGIEQTVYDYFRTVRKYTIKFPKLPCITVGNTIRTISLPAELCTVSANQVRSLPLYQIFFPQFSMHSCSVRCAPRLSVYVPYTELPSPYTHTRCCFFYI